jgi:hypothetical protein
MTTKITVVFEFDKIDNLSEVIDAIEESCETMQIGFNADICYVEGVEEVE